MKSVTRKDLVGFLKEFYGDTPGVLARSKAIYRPLICPFDQLLNSLPERQRVLDIGCGTGVFLQLVAKYRNPSAISGLEINLQAVERARQLFPASEYSVPARVEIYDGITLPDWIGEYDYVFLIDVLHHITPNQQEQTLHDIFGKLKTGARLIIKDIDAGQPFWCLFNKLHDLLLARQYTHERAASDLSAQLSQLGFVIKELITERIYVYPHFTLISEKQREKA